MAKEPSKIKPDYYRVGERDLIESWSKIFGPEQFRAIMKSHIQKYVHRYDQKNGRDDLEKANYFINRLAKWEDGRVHR